MRLYPNVTNLIPEVNKGRAVMRFAAVMLKEVGDALLLVERNEIIPILIGGARIDLPLAATSDLYGLLPKSRSACHCDPARRVGEAISLFMPFRVRLPRRPATRDSSQ
jgi:hypothetical protein